MSEPADDAGTADNERLLSEALRAQARSAPADERHTSVFGPKPPETLPSYGLLSGPAANSLEQERAALDSMEADAVTAAGATSPAQPAAPPPPPQLAVRWILLLAVLLGLAAGSVIGLLTLL